MIIEGNHQRAWRDGEKRESRLVFIGRKPRRPRCDVLHASPASRTVPATVRATGSVAAMPDHPATFPSVPSSSRRRFSATPRPSRSATARCAWSSGPAARDGQRPCRRDPLRRADARRQGAPHRRRRRAGRADRCRRQRSSGSPSGRGNGSTTSPRARAARSPSPVGRQAVVRFADGRERTFDHAARGRRPRLRAEGAAARRRPLRRRDAVVGGDRRRAGARSNGRARTSASPSRRTGATSSPPCRRTRCTAGGSRTARTCA